MSAAEGRFNWKYAYIIMALATVIPPYTTFVYGFSVHDGHLGVDIAMYALFWTIYPSGFPWGGLQVLTYYSLTAGLSLGFFNILFAFQLIRYIRGKTSRKRTLVVGALTLVLPMYSMTVALPIMLLSGNFSFIGPIPIQLITGLLLMRVAGPPEEPTTPW